MSHRPFHGLNDEGLDPNDWLEIAVRRNHWYRSTAKSISSRFPISKGKVVDLGSAGGNLLHHLRNEYNENVRLVGLEINQDLVESAREKYGADGLTFIATDGYFQEMPEQDFDLVTAFYLCHHWESPDVFFQTVWRLVKPGGSAYFFDIDPESILAKVMTLRLLSPILHYTHKGFSGYVHSFHESYSMKTLIRCASMLPGVKVNTQRRPGTLELVLKKQGGNRNEE